jgi:uncharacterized protein
MADTFRACLERGVELFNRQEFYEAHEAWEDGWKDELSDDRLLLQGLIQVAAGFYKLQVGAPNGTVKLLDHALLKLRKFSERSLGVDLAKLLPSVEQWRAQAAQMVQEKRAAYDPAALPKIGWV